MEFKTDQPFQVRIKQSVINNVGGDKHLIYAC